jgi:hypothetical protein
MRATCLVHPFLFDLITWIIFDEAYKLWRSYNGRNTIQRRNEFRYFIPSHFAACNTFVSRG